MKGQAGFFDLDERYAALSEAGDPLERLAQVVDFEVFRHQLRAALNRLDRGQGGRPPYGPVLMFKVLVLQALYNLSDDQTEFQIRDRLSFMRFLGLGLSDKVPDAKTIWLFRELLVRAEAMKKLFGRFEDGLRDKGYFAMGGQIVDATIVEAPHQRNSDGEKADLKASKIPEDWQANPAKLAQKDRDARWTLKRGRKAMVRPDGAKVEELVIPAFGYKNHVGTDKRFGFIRRYVVTHAAAHDGARLPDLLDKTNMASPGRYRLSLGPQRTGHGARRLRLEGSFQEAQGQADARSTSQGQRRPLQGALGHRARLCRREAPLQIVRPHRRHGPRRRQDRHGQSGLQLLPPRLAPG